MRVIHIRIHIQHHRHRRQPSPVVVRVIRGVLARQVGRHTMSHRAATVVAMATGRVILRRCMITRRRLRVVVVVRRSRVALTEPARAMGRRILIIGRSSEMSETQSTLFNRRARYFSIAGASVEKG